MVASITAEGIQPLVESKPGHRAVSPGCPATREAAEGQACTPSGAYCVYDRLEWFCSECFSGYPGFPLDGCFRSRHMAMRRQRGDTRLVSADRFSGGLV